MLSPVCSTARVAENQALSMLSAERSSCPGQGLHGDAHRGQLTSPPWLGGTGGPAAVALALQDMLESSHLPTLLPPSLHYFQLQQTPKQ